MIFMNEQPKNLNLKQRWLDVVNHKFTLKDALITHVTVLSLYRDSVLKEKREKKRRKKNK